MFPSPCKLTGGMFKLCIYIRFLGVNHLGHKNALKWSFVPVSEIRRKFGAAKFGSLFTFLGIPFQEGERERESPLFFLYRENIG